MPNNGKPELHCLQTCRYANHTDVKCRGGTVCCNAVCAHYQHPPNDLLKACTVCFCWLSCCYAT
jgi:hypothetical protein